MAWGTGGEEVRERAKVALAQSRVRLCVLTQCARDLQHPEKGPRLRELVARLYTSVDEIEELLNR